jgi:hypothetical protein
MLAACRRRASIANFPISSAIKSCTRDFRAWGRDLFLRRDTTLSSVGAGLDFAAGTNFNSKLLAARAVTDGQHSRAGSWRVSAQASVSY